MTGCQSTEGRPGGGWTQPQDGLSFAQFGESNRHYASTNMNEHSSRSHVLFKMVIKRGFTAGNLRSASAASFRSEDTRAPAAHLPTDTDWEKDPHVPVRVSALNYVDLAGSERIKKSGATGQALKETQHINTSLLTLGSVISKLAQGDKTQHVNYRDSKLTLLLSSSLGGNASTTMIATIAPGDSNREESINTLRYATRASKIVNDTGVNEMDNLNAFMDQYWDEIQGLKQQLQQQQDVATAKDEELRSSRHETEKRLSQLKHHAEAAEKQLAMERQQAAAEREQLLRELDVLQDKLAEERRLRKAEQAQQQKSGEHERRVVELQRQLQEERQSTASTRDEQRAVALAQLARVEAQLAGQSQELSALQQEREQWQTRRLQQPTAGSEGAVDDWSAQRVHELERELQVLETHAQALRAQNESLASQLDSGATADASSRSAAMTNTLILAQRELKAAQGQVDKMRGELVRARREAVSQGRAMADQLDELRQQLRKMAAAKISDDEVANFDVPQGQVLWFHAHVLPQIFALADPEAAMSLLQPHPTAPVRTPHLPVGVVVGVDQSAIAVALQANEALQQQLERLVPARLTEHQFWLNYFSHVHATKAHVAAQARARAVQQSQAGGGMLLDEQLRNAFVGVLAEGVLIRKYDADGSVTQVKLWLSDVASGTLSWLVEGGYEPPGALSLDEVVDVQLGKHSEPFQVGAGISAVEELCFSLLTYRSTLDLEASARMERQALVEGFELLVSSLGQRYKHVHSPSA